MQFYVRIILILIFGNLIGTVTNCWSLNLWINDNRAQSGSFNQHLQFLMNKDSPKAPTGLFIFFIITDTGFIVYWFITWLGLLPPDLLYNDYSNPIMVDWNWSFLPIDLLVSATGLYSFRLYRKGSKEWVTYAWSSLLLTFCSGLMAIAFWTIHRDFDPTWWVPNLVLLLYPVFYLRKIRTLIS